MDELISVIINVYNGEKYIKKCLESIINQTYKNLEILIINDGSTDDTLNICQSYNDKRIRIITHNNMGLSKSRNVGIDNAKGEYLYFVDADDYVENDVIEYLYGLSKKYNALISTCLPLDIYDYNFRVQNKEEKIEVISELDMLKKILLNQERAGTIWNKLIKNDLFNEIRFEDRIVNDVVVTYKLVLLANKIVYSNQVKYYYLKHSDSILGKKDPNHSIDLIKAMQERYTKIKEIYPNLIENEVCFIMMVMSIYVMKNEKTKKYIEDNKLLKLAKEHFSFKILKCKMRTNDKIKILIFRINPKVYKAIVNKFF